jgi:ClpP class serine protease
MGDQFVKAVARGRRVTESKVREDFGQGRIFDARRAVGVGMCDRIATLDQVLAELGVSRVTAQPQRMVFLYRRPLRTESKLRMSTAPVD